MLIRVHLGATRTMDVIILFLSADLFLTSRSTDFTLRYTGDKQNRCSAFFFLFADVRAIVLELPQTRLRSLKSIKSYQEERPILYFNFKYSTQLYLLATPTARYNTETS
jgi:hypothetical protein